MKYEQIGVIKMTQQFGRLTAEDLDCYRELFSGITKKLQRFCYSNFYIFDVRKTIRILKIYRQWLIAQEDIGFNDLYQKFWEESEMDITGVSLLLLPKGHNKEREIKRIDDVIALIDQFGTSYVFNDVQSNAVGFAEKSYLYPATRESLEEIYHRSVKEENREYCRNIKDYLEVYPEPYPDYDSLVSFFDDNEKDVNADSNIYD